VFASQTEKFLAEHPRFGAEAATVREFFDRSERAFFGVPAGSRDRSRAGAPDVGNGESEVGWLYRSARRLARIEQPGR
jgi:hypothetical protein